MNSGTKRRYPAGKLLRRIWSRSCSTTLRTLPSLSLTRPNLGAITSLSLTIMPMWTSKMPGSLPVLCMLGTVNRLCVTMSSCFCFCMKPSDQLLVSNTMAHPAFWHRGVSFRRCSGICFPSRCLRHARQRTKVSQVPPAVGTGKQQQVESIRHFRRHFFLGEE